MCVCFLWHSLLFHPIQWKEKERESEVVCVYVCARTRERGNLKSDGPPMGDELFPVWASALVLSQSLPLHWGDSGDSPPEKI